MYWPSEQLAWGFGFFKVHWGFFPLFFLLFCFVFVLLVLFCWVAHILWLSLIRLTEIKHLLRHERAQPDTQKMPWLSWDCCVNGEEVSTHMALTLFQLMPTTVWSTRTEERVQKAQRALEGFNKWVSKNTWVTAYGARPRETESNRLRKGAAITWILAAFHEAFANFDFLLNHVGCVTEKASL